MSRRQGPGVYVESGGEFRWLRSWKYPCGGRNVSSFQTYVSEAEFTYVTVRVVNKLFDSALTDLSLEMQKGFKAHKFGLFEGEMFCFM